MIGWALTQVPAWWFLWRSTASGAYIVRFRQRRTVPASAARMGSPSPVTAAARCGQEHGSGGTPRRFWAGLWVGLLGFRLVFAFMRYVSLLPHLLQRELAALTA